MIASSAVIAFATPPETGARAAVPVEHPLDDRGARQHQHGRVEVGRQGVEPGRGGQPGRARGLQGAGVGVEHDEVRADAAEIARHRQTHRAETDEQDRHGFLPCPDV
jgi:hypothetical protein